MMVPAVMVPPMALMPPNQTTATTPRLMASIMNGPVTTLIRIAWIDVSVRPSLALLNRRFSWSLRTNALTTRTPERFS